MSSSDMSMQEQSKPQEHLKYIQNILGKKTGGYNHDSSYSSNYSSMINNSATPSRPNTAGSLSSQLNSNPTPVNTYSNYPMPTSSHDLHRNRTVGATYNNVNFGGGNTNSNAPGSVSSFAPITGTLPNYDPYSHAYSLSSGGSGGGVVLAHLDQSIVNAFKNLQTPVKDTQASSITSPPPHIPSVPVSTYTNVGSVVVTPIKQRPSSLNTLNGLNATPNRSEPRPIQSFSALPSIHSTPRQVTPVRTRPRPASSTSPDAPLYVPQPQPGLAKPKPLASIGTLPAQVPVAAQSNAEATRESRPRLTSPSKAADIGSISAQLRENKQLRERERARLAAKPKTLTKDPVPMSREIHVQPQQQQPQQPEEGKNENSNIQHALMHLKTKSRLKPQDRPLDKQPVSVVPIASSPRETPVKGLGLGLYSYDEADIWTMTPTHAHKSPFESSMTRSSPYQSFTNDIAEEEAILFDPTEVTHTHTHAHASGSLNSVAVSKIPSSYSGSTAPSFANDVSVAATAPRSRIPQLHLTRTSSNNTSLSPSHKSPTHSTASSIPAPSSIQGPVMDDAVVSSIDDAIKRRLHLSLQSPATTQHQQNSPLYSSLNDSAVNLFQLDDALDDSMLFTPEEKSTPAVSFAQQPKPIAAPVAPRVRSGTSTVGAVSNVGVTRALTTTKHTQGSTPATSTTTSTTVGISGVRRTTTSASTTAPRTKRATSVKPSPQPAVTAKPVTTKPVVKTTTVPATVTKKKEEEKRPARGKSSAPSTISRQPIKTLEMDQDREINVNALAALMGIATNNNNANQSYPVPSAINTVVSSSVTLTHTPATHTPTPAPAAVPKKKKKIPVRSHSTHPRPHMPNPTVSVLSPSVDPLEHLVCKWSEVSFLLRNDIHSQDDYIDVLAHARQARNFIDTVALLSDKFQVPKGRLSRILLPYNNDTNVTDQASSALLLSSIEQEKESELISRMDLYLQHTNDEVTLDNGHTCHVSYNSCNDLVIAATQLRQLVRVKIADENDLAQAESAVYEIIGFGERVNQILTCIKDNSFLEDVERMTIESKLNTEVDDSDPDALPEEVLSSDAYIFSQLAVNPHDEEYDFIERHLSNMPKYY